MRDHAAIEELIALRALDGLDPADERQLAAQRTDHGADCEECLGLESAYDEVAGRLGFALEPAEIREGFEEEIVAAARGGELERPSGTLASPEGAASRETSASPEAAASIAGGKERRRFATPIRALAGVVAAALIVAAGVGGYLLAPREETTTQAFEAFVQGENVRTVALSGSANGTMNVYYAPGTSDVFVAGSGLEEPPSGKAYELWQFQGKTPVSAGCFAPENGNVLHEVNTDLSGADALAITVESASCPSAPTSQPVMSGEVL